MSSPTPHPPGAARLAGQAPAGRIRRAAAADAEQIEAIIAAGRDYLRAQGLSQWQDGTGRRPIARDLAHGWGQVLLTGDEEISGYAALVEGVDPAYTAIFDGAWREGATEYVAIHSFALAAESRGRGLAAPFLRGLIGQAQALGHTDVRIDTHPGNVIMRKVIEAAGFVRRGVVEFEIPDGRRDAFQLCLPA